MKRIWKRKGFTMVEVLIVVAVLAVLAGVAGVAITRYQRSLHQMEMDGHAKEIFVAAQNHLTVAKSQGYMGVNQFGTALDKTDAEALYGVGLENDIFYYVVNGSGAFQPNSLLSVILPYGSIDETVRIGGRYVLSYQKSTGTMLDVFYDSAAGQRFGTDFEDLDSSSFRDFLRRYQGTANKTNRAKFSNEAGAVDQSRIIGWYGGEGTSLAALPEESTQPGAPQLRVFNGEKLFALVLLDSRASGAWNLKLDIKGAESNVGPISLSLLKKDKDQANVEETYVTSCVNPKGGHYVVRKSYAELIDNEVAAKYAEEALKAYTYCFVIWLDDISAQGLRFADTFPDLIPGEDIRLTAKLTQTDDHGTVELVSDTYRTNSLFAYNKDDNSGDTPNVAKIGYIRHLENLDPNVSGFDYNNAKSSYVNADSKVQAQQISDLTWVGKSIYGAAGKLTTNSFYPVSPAYALDYDGGQHQITGVTVDTNHNGAGLFGTLSSSSSVKDLLLIDFDIKVSGANAGALAGNLTGSAVTNVVAYHTAGNDEKGVSVTGATGSAGGLVGSATASSTISKSAAALVVSATGSAGGLVGEAASASVEYSYSGGHTENGAYSHTNYNITGAMAGGLVGTATDARINASYSTCSAYSNSASGAAGGFVGKVMGDSSRINGGSYAAGLVQGVSGAKLGAFAGIVENNVTIGTAENPCKYYMIVNEIADPENESSYIYVPAMGQSASGNTHIAAFDESAASYDGFVGDPATWRYAVTYDNQLYQYYHEAGENGKGTYSLKPLIVPREDLSFVATHYGDWPAPELWVINVG